MLKYCGLAAQNHWENLRISTGFYPAVFYKLKNLRISKVCAQAFKLPTSIVVHIKFSLNGSVGGCFSTVSTQPTIKTTILNFNELVIKGTGAS